MWSRREPFEGHDTGERGNDAGNSAPSWEDYLRALSQEGLRYRPASLSKALAERERAAGKPRTSEKDGK